MDKQIENLIELAKENPTLEIKLMVNYEVCAGDDCTYWMAGISSIEKTNYWNHNERVYIGEDEIKDEMDCQEISEEEYAIMLKDGTIKEAIIVYVDI
jgi:hypothetical protein